MLLIEEVKLLRKHLPKIKMLTVATPVAGGPVDSAYELIMDMALARNIFEKIAMCKNDTFPRIEKELENKAQNNKKPIRVKDIFNRIIHGAYIHKSGKDLHVINDRGDEYIISAEEFMNVLDSLCLEDHETVLIMCEILRKKIQASQDVYGREGASDKFLTMMYQIIRDYLPWLVHSYCSTGDLAQKVVAKFFPEQTNNKLLSTFCISGTKYGGAFFIPGYFAIELESRWEQESDEVVEKRMINLYDLLSLVEKYTEQISENLSR